MRQWIALGVAAALVAASVPFLRSSDGTLADVLAKGRAALARSPATAREVDPPPLTAVDLSRIQLEGRAAVAPAYKGRTARLTLDVGLQRAALSLLAAGKVAEGAIVVTDVKTGRVLVWASHLRDAPHRDLAVEATAPSASIFKIVTGAALIEAGGVTSQTRQCYLGGEQRIRPSDLIEDRRRDRYCATLTEAMGRSLNTVFARLALKHLDRDRLHAAAVRFGYGAELPFDVRVAPSEVKLPEDELGFARTAAGFWNTTLSPYLGAQIAGAIANQGEMIRAYVVESVSEGQREIYRAPEGRRVVRRVVERPVAAALTTMLEATVDLGTSYRSFHDRDGRPYLPEIRVAGKTGTLTRPQPETLYTWFVGFAPSRAPEVAISVLVANGRAWRVKATNVACDLLRAYFARRDAPGVTDPLGGSAARARLR